MDDLATYKRDAQEALDNIGHIQRFEMAGECDDLDGGRTRVLTIDTDKPGIIGQIIDNGPVFTLTTDGVKEEKPLVAHYLHFMANVDLKNADVQKAVGYDAITQARQAVANFFMLKMASSLSLPETEPAKPSKGKATTRSS